MRYRLETADGSTVTVAGARIVPDGGRWDDGPANTFRLPAGELRPGLINPHDHLHRNHYPRLGSPPYADSYEWGEDIHAAHAGEIARGRSFDRSDALLFGALKNLLAGATTVVHHDPWEPAFDRSFPVRLARVRAAHSLGLDAPPAADDGTSEAASRVPEQPERDPAEPSDGGTRSGGRRPFSIHLCEGVTPAIADEVRSLDRLGYVDEHLLAVHLVGVDGPGIERLHEACAAVVWCPTSNCFLFDRTAPRELLRSGMDVLVGSDSLLTADGTLLDELRAARQVGVLSDQAILDGVGAVAARRLGRPEPTLRPGAAADLTLFRRPPLEARAADILLAIVDGVPRLGVPELAPLFRATAVDTECLLVRGEERLVAAPLGRVAADVAEVWPEAARILA